ncbi:MAG: hypothetical protein DMD43_10460, partial [Gemmatimonadetes bacterium]
MGGTGSYTLTLQRQDGASTSLSGITAVAASGTAVRAAIASANPGQTITLTGSGLQASDRVVFTAADNAGSAGPTGLITPSSVAGDGTSLQVVVPNEAVTGMVRLARENAGRMVQIVPTLSDVQTFSGSYHGGLLRLRGTGFVEGSSSVQFGAQTVVDTGPFSGIDVFGLNVENDTAQFTVPSGVPTGPITVSTMGGTSVAFPLTFTGIVATAGSGTPANAGQASANPGQAITLTGSGFDFTTDVVFPTFDSGGNAGERIV